MKSSPIAPDSPLDTTVNRLGVFMVPLDRPGPKARIFDCMNGPTMIWISKTQQINMYRSTLLQ